LQEKATSLQNNNPAYLSELGYELLMQGRVRDALKCYQNAYKLDDTCNTALYGDDIFTLFLKSGTPGSY